MALQRSQLFDLQVLHQLCGLGLCGIKILNHLDAASGHSSLTALNWLLAVIFTSACAGGDRVLVRAIREDGRATKTTGVHVQRQGMDSSSRFAIALPKPPMRKAWQSFNQAARRS